MADAQHETAVAAVAARIQELYQKRVPFRVYHGSTNGTHKSRRTANNVVDTSSLNRVLSVDKMTKTAIVEPNVSMETLLKATLQQDLLPLVVMEFPSITTGGGFSGTSGESSSFRHGLFEATVNWIEIVLANGEITRASRADKPDLFRGAASAFGTLGIITTLEINLRDASSYVTLEYHHFSNASSTTRFIQEQTKNPSIDYIDGITFSMDSMVVCIGRLTNTVPPEASIRQLRRSIDPWFYVHVDHLRKSISKDNGAIRTDYIPVTDYLFRYDRGGFWTGRYAYKYFLTPFNRITRCLLNPLMNAQIMYKALHKSGFADYYLIQDVGVPFDKADEFLEWLDKTYGLYPLWLCPLRVSRQSNDSAHGVLFSLGSNNIGDMLNVGIWGPLSWNRRTAITQNRRLEQKVASLGGKKWMYGQGYFTEEEFWNMYDRASYDKLRAKYHAEYLPNIYNKVNVDIAAEEEAAVRASFFAVFMSFVWGIWPLRGIYGVLSAIISGDYLLSSPLTVDGSSDSQRARKEK